MPRGDKLSPAVLEAERIIEEHKDRATNKINDEWRGEAACRGMDRRIFFAPERKITDTYYEEAYDTCRRCVVAASCLAEAVLEERGQAQANIFGVRGGLIPRERIGIALRLGIRKGESPLEEIA